MDNNRAKSLEIEILEVLTSSKLVLTINEIMDLLEVKPSHRTLQRALNYLVEEKRIYRLGKGRAIRYKSVALGKAAFMSSTDKLYPNKLEPDNLNSDKHSYITYINITENSRKILNYVSQPIEARSPVSYNSNLLDAYKPNKTWYLDENTRIFLQQIGKMHDDQQDAHTLRREILHRLLIDLSWASSKLEGNTYSRLDTQRLIDFEQSAEGKDAIETQMILNHKQAITFLVENIDVISFNKYTLLNLHGLLSESLLYDAHDSGRLRTNIVDIGGFVYKPIAIPQLIEECFSLILEKAQAIKDPFEQLFFIMVHIPYLQAFVDVNKRVSRLAANIPLLKFNLCPLTFIGVSEQAYIDGYIGVYELQDYSLLKDVFIWAYERSAQEYLAVQKSMVAPDPIRIKNREHIHKIINAIVVERLKNYEQYIKQYALDNVSASDRKLFEHFVLEDLKNLHEGILARYRLKKSDFDAWRNSKNINIR